MVVMHLLRVALAHHIQVYELDAQPSTNPLPRPRLVYFEQPATEFPEVKALVDQTTQRYDLVSSPSHPPTYPPISFHPPTHLPHPPTHLPHKDLRVYENVPFAQGLKQCIETEGGAALAFLLGTRKGDPNCKEQETFAPSSTWMPPFMRVNPILDWRYGHIWHFLRRYELPYCSLYDQGYTSLGTYVFPPPTHPPTHPSTHPPPSSQTTGKVDDTRPNPALAKEDGSGGFHPAYMLSDWSKCFNPPTHPLPTTRKDSNPSRSSHPPTYPPTQPKQA